MSIPLAFIARASALDDASLETHPTRRDALLAHFVHEGLTQCSTLAGRSLHQTPLAALQDGAGLHETDFIRVPVRMPRRRLHQGAHGKVSQQQSRPFLLDSLRGLRAQGACRQAQMCFELLETLFKLPTLMGEAHERLDGRELGIKPGGDQPHRRAQCAGAGIASRWYSSTRAVNPFPPRLLLFW